MNRRKVLLIAGLLSLPLLLGNTKGDGCSTTEMQKQTQEKLTHVQDMMRVQPATQIGFSMDRWLLNERNVRFNSPNKMNYLYIVLADGTWLKVTIIGKLASTSKRLTPPEGWAIWNGSWTREQMPDEMGTWGHSEPAKVGMLTLGSLIETGGFMSYIYSEVPLTFTNMNRPMVEIKFEVTDEERRQLQQKLEEVKQLSKGK